MLHSSNDCFNDIARFNAWTTALAEVRPVSGALGREVGPGTTVFDALERQVGSRFGGKAGQAGRGRLILAQGRPPRTLSWPWNDDFESPWMSN